MTDDDAIRVLQNRMAFSLDSYILAQDQVIARLLALRSENAKLRAVAEAAEVYSRRSWNYVGVTLMGDERVEGESDFRGFETSKRALDDALKAWKS